MKNKLPLYIDNKELPVDKYNMNKKQDNSGSYGYVNILYLTSIIITVLSVITVVFLGNR